jgi:hypothetical protein
VPDATPEQRAAARAALQAGVSTDTTDLLEALRALYGDAYAAGGLAAAQQLPATALAANLAGVYGTTDPAAAWASWEPGNLNAATLLDDGGLAGLLADAGITVQGMVGSLLDRMGTVLADGALNGDSVDTIAGALGDLVDDPQRAFTIANTETARAVEAASQAQYADQGVQQWEWLLSPGACPECEEAQAGSPYDVGGGPDLPDHPNCRCSSSPIDPGTGLATGEEDGGD